MLKNTMPDEGSVFKFSHEKNFSPGEKTSDGKEKPLQVLQEALNPQFSKYDDFIKVVTYS